MSEVASIRTMRKGDLPALLVFYEEAFRLNWPGSDWEKVRKAARLRMHRALDAESGEAILLAEDESGLIVAYAWLALGRSGDGAVSGTIEGFGVHPEHRRHGVGQIMADAVQEWAFGMWKVSRLQGVVSLTNEPIINLLEKTAFTARFVTYIKERPEAEGSP